MTDDRITRRLVRDQRGFTLIEMLAVLIIIGLLAVIAVPTFLAQREKAHDAESKQAARTAALAMETWSIDRDGAYDGASEAGLVAIEPVLASAGVSVASAAGASYELSVASASGNAFSIGWAADGGWRLTCTTAGRAGCPSSGAWD